MPDFLEEAWVGIRPFVEDFGDDLERELVPPAEEAGRKAGDKAGEGFGDGLNKKLMLASAAIAGSAQIIANSYQAGTHEIVALTGAAGDELSGLVDEAEDAAGRVSTAFEEVSTVLAKLEQRTDLQGDALENLTVQITQLAELTHTDASDSVTEIVDLFQAWQIETAKQSETLDMLYAASQRSGAPISAIISTLVAGAGPLKNFNFTFEESVALIASIEQKGGNAPKIIQALQQAFVRLSATSNDPEAALERITERIREAETTAQATRIAVDAFGTRAGPVLAAAIRKGRFEIEDFVAALEDSRGAIADTRDETTTLNDKFSELRNRVTGLAGPFAQQAAVIATIVTGVGPLVTGYKAATTALETMTVAQLAANAAMFAAPAAIIGGGYVLLKGQIDDTAESIFNLDRAFHSMGGAGGADGGPVGLTNFQKQMAAIQEATKGMNLDFDDQQQVLDLLRNKYIEVDGEYVKNKDHVDVLGVSHDKLKVAIAAVADDVPGLEVKLDRFGDVVGVTQRKVHKAADEFPRFAGMGKKAFIEWESGTSDALSSVDDKLDALADKTDLTAHRIQRSLHNQIQDQLDYEKNWAKVVARSGGENDNLLKHLQDMGLEGANVVAALADANDKEFHRITGQWRRSRSIADRTSQEIGDSLRRGIGGGARGAKVDVDALTESITGLLAAAAQAKELDFGNGVPGAVNTRHHKGGRP